MLSVRCLLCAIAVVVAAAPYRNSRRFIMSPFPEKQTTSAYRKCGEHFYRRRRVHQCGLWDKNSTFCCTLLQTPFLFLPPRRPPPPWHAQVRNTVGPKEHNRKAPRSIWRSPPAPRLPDDLPTIHSEPNCVARATAYNLCTDKQLSLR